MEWADIRLDLAALMEIDMRQGEQWYYLRNARQGVAGKALQAACGRHPAIGSANSRKFGAKG